MSASACYTKLRNQVLSLSELYTRGEEGKRQMTPLGNFFHTSRFPIWEQISKWFAAFSVSHL
jgi:hypothetical protein